MLRLPLSISLIIKIMQTYISEIHSFKQSQVALFVGEITSIQQPTILLFLILTGLGDGMTRSRTSQIPIVTRFQVSHLSQVSVLPFSHFSLFFWPFLFENEKRLVKLKVAKKHYESRSALDKIKRILAAIRQNIAANQVYLVQHIHEKWMSFKSNCQAIFTLKG